MWLTVVSLLACTLGDSGSPALLGDVVEFDMTTVLDDFVPGTESGSLYPRSRIDRARSFFGEVDHGAGFPVVYDAGAVDYQVGRHGEGVRLDRPLGFMVGDADQPRVNGVRVHLLNGQGDATVRFLDVNGTQIWARRHAFLRSSASSPWVDFAYDGPAAATVNTIRIEVRGGSAQLRQVELLFQRPTPSDDDLRTTFLYTLGQLGGCYDPVAGLVSANCRDETGTGYVPDASGLFALTSATAANLGLVDRAAALAVVGAVQDALLALPREPETGLLPQQTDGVGATGACIWSTRATVVALESTILASEMLGQSSTSLERVLSDIRWDELSVNGALPISGGVDCRGQPIGWMHGAFGSSITLLQIAHAAATGDLAPMGDVATVSPLDVTGSEAELAALLFPLEGDSFLGTAWATFRAEHAQGQIAVADGGWIGRSECEVPEPWALGAVDDLLQVSTPQQGTLDRLGYEVGCPHYPAMALAEAPELGDTFRALMDEGLLSPLSSVESVAVDAEGTLRWNHHQRSWSLALQSLGLLRALSDGDYPPYRELPGNSFLRGGHEEVFPRY